MAETKMISIRLLIDKEKNKVLFAESDKEFVEFLFSFLTLPIGTIVSLANKESNLGSMDVLYKSVEALDKQYLQTEFCKEMLLKPRSASEEKYKSLALDFDASTKGPWPPYYYACPRWTCYTETHCLMSMFVNAKCLCGMEMNKAIIVRRSTIENDRRLGTFVNGIGKFMITDDLEVRTVSTGSSLSILCSFGIKDGTALEEKIVSVGIDQALDLLKRSMISKTPITDVSLSKQIERNKQVIKTKPVDIKFELKSDIKTVNLDILIRKSTNKVLYAMAKSDFIDFLFSFLTLPVGSVVELLGGYSFIGSMDNLYKSVEVLCNADPEQFGKGKDLLLHPKVAWHHGCENQLWKVRELESCARGNVLKCSTCYDTRVNDPICQHGIGRANLCLVNPKFPNTVTERGGGFIQKSIAFLITDELLVEPYSQISSISFINNQRVPFSDLEERSVTVSEEAALSLLKASLTSKTALTDVFCRKHQGDFGLVRRLIVQP